MAGGRGKMKGGIIASRTLFCFSCLFVCLTDVDPVIGFAVPRIYSVEMGAGIRATYITVMNTPLGRVEEYNCGA